MSAINILVQPTAGAVHIMTDGLAYDAYGVVQSIGTKCHTIPHAKCAISSMGAGGAAFVFAAELSKMFQSFDGIVEDAETAFPEIYSQYEDRFDQATFAEIELHVSGWSDARSKPESYFMQMRGGDSDQYWDELYRASSYKNDPFKMQAVDGMIGNPDPSIEEFVQAGYVIHGATESEIAASTNPEVDLLHLMEIQRRMTTARPGYPPHHIVGGFALLTTITASATTQKVVHRWTEDQIGEPVKPLPIDWKAWRAARTVTASGVDFTSLSRLQRERIAKKARKGTLR